MKNTLSRILLACVVSAGAVGTASAVPINLLENGSFEDNAVASGSWTILKNRFVPGWDVKGTGLELRNNVAGSAYDGHNFAELDTTANSWISQTFETILNQTYLLSFFYSPRMGVSAASNIIDVLIDGMTVLSATGNGIGALGNVWTQYTYSFVATDDSTTLKFRAGGISDSVGGSLDNISVTEVHATPTVDAPASVPEPATWSMMIVGLAGALTMSRRRAR